MSLSLCTVWLSSLNNIGTLSVSPPTHRPLYTHSLPTHHPLPAHFPHTHHPLPAPFPHTLHPLTAHSPPTLHREWQGCAVTPDAMSVTPLSAIYREHSWLTIYRDWLPPNGRRVSWRCVRCYLLCGGGALVM